MAWPQKPAAPKNSQPAPILAGFDINATRALAVYGPAAFEPRALPLDEDREELPMILSLAARRPQLGRAGAALCRQAPHLTCADFLASLGEKRLWHAGRHRLDPNKATALGVERLHAAGPDAKGLVAAVPAYLNRAQATLLAP